MGSEGYLLNQFLAPRTNRRTDAWGGTAEKRRRLPVEIVRRTREAVGRDFVICYRMSMADYVDGGQIWDEIVALAIEVEAAGAAASGSSPTSSVERTSRRRSTPSAPSARARSSPPGCRPTQA